ncbi:MAG TPA: tetratricopeptide repeat protein, partial [Ohtaekwangia sp.]
DRLWVEDNFRWLISVFGYPYRHDEQMLVSAKHFPNTFRSDKVVIENTIRDLCNLLQIPEGIVTFETITDIRDAQGVPYELEGKPFETDLVVVNGNYKIVIANSLRSHPKRLFYDIIYEFIRIKLHHSNVPFDSGTGDDTGNDTALFIYLAGIYFGFGVLLSQNLKDTGVVNDGFWETKWSYISDMPDEVMAFGLATYATLIEQDGSAWIDSLPRGLKTQFEKAMAYLREHPSPLYDRNELEATALFRKSDDQYAKNEFEEAVSSLQRVLFLTKDESVRTNVFNNLGYYNLRLKNYTQSVSYFRNAIQLLPEYGYANDNLGYALIQLVQLEEGKEWLDKALRTGNNDIAYTYRNLALYHQAKGELDDAENYFTKAFAAETVPVDLLEYHYAEFLFQKGEQKKGLLYLHKAVEKGEPEAVEKMKTIGKVN